ncbi:MAG: hypothetical protein ACUVTM_04620 [Candidatus Bathyarchaeia archaeon]
MGALISLNLYKVEAELGGEGQEQLPKFFILSVESQPMIVRRYLNP